MVIKKEYYFSDYLFNQNLKDEVFEQKTEFLSDEQLQKDENFWEENRKTPLSESEKNIYVMMDELNNVPKFKKSCKAL